MLFEVLIAAFAVMLVSLAGIVFMQHTARNFLEKKLSFLVSFSAGVFLITSGALTLEVFELTTVWVGTGIIVSGYVLAWIMHLLLPETHHHHDTLCSHSHGGARKLLIGDAIHNMADGVVLVTSFAVSPALGLAVATSVVIHETLQEISEFFVLRQAGYSIRKALLVNFMVSGTILIGVLIGYFALVSNELEALLLGLSAGFFLHVVIHDLIPRRSHHETISRFLLHVIFVVIGVVLMGVIASSFGE
jgi:zinc transporter ZupT